jgi:hypothetical protein
MRTNPQGIGRQFQFLHKGLTRVDPCASLTLKITNEQLAVSLRQLRHTSPQTNILPLKLLRRTSSWRLIPGGFVHRIAEVFQVNFFRKALAAAQRITIGFLYLFYSYNDAVDDLIGERLGIETATRAKNTGQPRVNQIEFAPGFVRVRIEPGKELRKFFWRGIARSLFIG